MKANQPKPAAPAPSAAPAAAAAPAGGPKEALTAPLAGLVLRIPTKPGDTVKSGDPVIVIEAMKMEMDIKAPRDCRVASIEVKQGDQLSAEQVLAYIE